jgi:hypothetical protein
MRRYFATFLTVLLSISTLHAPGIQAQASLRLLDVIEDTLVTNPPASDPLLAGLAGIEIGTRPARARRSTVWLRLPESGLQFLCLRVRSRNGQYRYSGLYSVAGRGGELVQARIDTGHSRDLNRFRNDEVTVLAELANQRCTRPEILVAASWTPDPPGDSLVLMVAVSSPVFFDHTGADRLDVRCSLLEGTHFTYKERCTGSRSRLRGSRTYIMHNCDWTRCNTPRFVIFVW